MSLTKCPKCNVVLMPGAAFCAYCGQRAVAEAPTSAPASAIPSRSVPPPERSALQGPCTVVYAGEETLDVRRVGRLVASVVGQPLPDITRDLRNSRGIVATKLDAAKAVALAETVERELRAPVLVVPNAETIALPPALRMRGVIVNAGGLRCNAYAWDRTEDIQVAWSQVFLIACARLELEEAVEMREEPGKTHIMTRYVPDLVMQKHYEFALDFVLMDPWRRLRLDQNTAAFSLTEMSQDPKETVAPLYRSAMNIERYAQDVPHNRAVTLLAAGASESAWEPFTFVNKRDFESYILWLMQLVRFGRPVPA